MAKFEVGKHYKNAKGLEVRVVGSHVYSGQTYLVCIAQYPSGDEYSYNVYANTGEAILSSDNLVPNKIKRKLWFNVYETSTFAHISKEIAEKRKSENRIACAEREIEFYEGEGLNG